jgi:formylglycine-generating enzyme required for sulfatase activity
MVRRLKPGCDAFAKRGGGWGTEGEYLRVAHRTMFMPDERDSRTSLRVVRALD